MKAHEAIDLLKQMIALPSPSGKEDKVADLIADKLKSLGFTPNRKGNNVWAVSPNYDKEKPTILLDAHIDTVSPANGWDTDPYTPTVKDDTLYGLGSNDTGGSVVSMLAAFAELTKSEQPYNLIYLASAEEENTGAGGIQSALPELGEIDLGIVGEPTGMNAAIAEKGLFVIDCTAHGRSGHAARNEGVNAIYEAMKDIEWFRTYQFPEVSPLLGAVKMTVTCIEAGTLHNVVPDKCKFTVDIRVNEFYTNEDIFATIAENVACTVTPRSFTLNSSGIEEEHPIVRRAVEMGRATFASPTTSNQAVMPFTTIKIGPGDSARSHTPNEHIHISEIEEAIDIFVNLLDRLEI